MTVAATVEKPRLYHFAEVMGLAEHGTVADLGIVESKLLHKIACWSRDYLTNPHPALGRNGHVCPWVDASMRTSRFFLAHMPRPQDNLQAVERDFLGLLERFLALEPSEGREAQLKTIVVVFSDLPEDITPQIVVALHSALKPQFVERGLMLGEFFPTCDKPGLHNPDFRPLRSPEPLIVIRSMVPNDIAFLHENKTFADAYVRNLRFNAVDEIATYLDGNRDRLASEHVGVLLGALAEFGVPIDQRWRETDPTTGALTTQCLIRHFDARLTHDAAEMKSPAWISFRIDGASEIQQHLGPGAVACAATEVYRIVRPIVRSANQLAFSGDWFSIAIWNISAKNLSLLVQRLRAELEAHSFSYLGTELDITVSIGTAIKGPLPLTSAIDWFTEAQRAAVKAGYGAGGKAGRKRKWPKP